MTTTCGKTSTEIRASLVQDIHGKKKEDKTTEGRDQALMSDWNLDPDNFGNHQQSQTGWQGRLLV